MEAALRHAAAALSGHAISGSLEAQVLLAEVLHVPRPWILAHGEARLTASEADSFLERISRLAAGEPLAYILGWWEFYGLRFRVEPSVMIPRPETETLVEHALAFLWARPSRRQAIDVGIGAGCIGLTLAVHVEDLKLAATDISRKALRIARENARALDVNHRIHWLQADLMAPFVGRFDLICANLPYLPRDRLPSLEVSKHEPRLALDGGEKGVASIRRLLAQLPNHLAPGGWALLEIDEGQADEARRDAQSQLPGCSARVEHDLSGRDRLLIIERGEEG